MFNIVLFGAPGSGKGTQSERLIDEYGLYHISTGQVLRDHIAQGTELGKIADSYISQGQLIPDELMVNILDHLLDNNPDYLEKGVIFDGFPRTVAQAESLNNLLKRRDAKVDAVVGLEVPEDELIDRLVKRGKETGRADDNPETISRRLEVYHNQTRPLRDYYMERGNYHAINGSGNVDSIFSSIKESLAKHV